MKKALIIFLALLSFSASAQFGIPSVNTNRELPIIDIPIDIGGTGRYIYVLNSLDQTVSILDTDASDAVIATLTLTASKNFCFLFYRSVDHAVYVLGTSYYNKIDADDNSGTLNTIVASGTCSETSPGNSSYVTWPFDILANGAGGPSGTDRWYPFFNLIADNTYNRNYYNYYERNKSLGQLTFGHSPGRNVRLHPRSKLLENSYNNGPISIRFARMLHWSKDVQTDGPFTLVENYAPADLSITMVASYVFGNFIMCNTNGAVYLQSTKYNLSPLLPTGNISGGISGGLNFLEYAANAGKVFWGWKNALGSPRMTVHTVGPGTYTTIGTIDRTAYKDTNETCTQDIMYNPHSGRIYVQGMGSSSTTGVAKIHVYDPTQAVLASMYLRSITVGEQMSTLRVGNTSLNSMCMNRTRYWEAPDVTY